jgi:large subunit ribosomal protein L23
MTIYGVIEGPRVTEKSTLAKENSRTLCFQVAVDANKTQIKQAVEKIFKVKVEEVRTMNNPGKLRRRGRFAGYRPDWKKAYVKLKADQKVPEYVEVV